MDQELVDSSAVRERMKNEINNNPELSARQAYDNVVQQIAREDRGNIPNFESARSIIDRERRRHIPEIPTTIADVDINGRWRLTADRRRFLSKLENGWGIAVYATDKPLKFLDNVTIFSWMALLNRSLVLTLSCLLFMGSTEIE
jgi:hypothetical protein